MKTKLEKWVLLIFVVFLNIQFGQAQSQVAKFEKLKILNDPLVGTIFKMDDETSTNNIIVDAIAVGIGTFNPMAILDVNGSLVAETVTVRNGISPNFGEANISPEGGIFKVPLGEGITENVSFPLMGGQNLKISLFEGRITGMKIESSPPSEEEVNATKKVAQKYEENVGILECGPSPNPFKNEVFVIPPLSCTKVVIYNQKGEIVYEGKSGKIDSSEWPSSAYLFLGLTQENRTIYKKIGIKK